MSENEIMELLREACRLALKKDMRGYQKLMGQAAAAISHHENNSRLLGEHLMASTFGLGRSWGDLYGIFSKAHGLLRGYSHLFPRGSHLFADYYNVFAICNVEPGHADENAARLTELVPLFHQLTGGGMGTDICCRAQLSFYRGELDAALLLAKEAFAAAMKNNQGLVALCAAELLTGIAKHKQDTALWRFYAGYINSVAEGAEGASRACQEQAELLCYIQDLSLGFLHSVPDWIIGGDFGTVSTPWGWEQKTDKLLAGSVPNAMLVRLQYFSYSGDSVKALLVADTMQKVYGMSDVALNAYLDFFRAGCYLRLNDTELVRACLASAVKVIAPDGLWLIAAEFAAAFGDLLYEAADSIDPSGSRRIREIGESYWKKLAPFRDEILRGATLGLTKREKEIAQLMLAGKSNAEIAQRLVISQRTVKGHITGIFSKYSISRRGQLANAMRETKDAKLADWTKF